MRPPLDSFKVRAPLRVSGSEYEIFDLRRAAAALGERLDRLPVSLLVLLENLLRHEDGESVTREDIASLAAWPLRGATREMAFHPVRVIMPDSSGIPLLADLAAMRNAIAERGGDPRQVNPRCPVDLIIDHSVSVQHAGTPQAFALNLAREFELNRERYAFARWAQASFVNLHIVPPGTGIIHQVNLEHLSRPIWSTKAGNRVQAFPDTVVGLDSHTPMINALGVLGWGIGGIEAASAMLGEPISMLVPDVIGCHVRGRLRSGLTCTDVALTLTERLRAKGVVGKVVEFFGPGLAGLSLPDRATVANMAPEYGATMGFFPIDEETLRFLRSTGRSPVDVALAEAYAKHQGLWSRPESAATYADEIDLDLDAIEPSVAGPRRPQDRLSLSAVRGSFKGAVAASRRPAKAVAQDAALRDGDIVIAAITSCTNTSNPSAMIGAGLLAQNAVRKGLARKPWVKASLSPGSRVVADYLGRSGLQAALDALGFHLTGFGCMTCAGGSGPLDPSVARAIETDRLNACAILSGNRNFEGRIHPLVNSAYLASPALVVAYAIAGSILVDLTREPLGNGADGEPVRLRDIWPSDEDIATAAANSIDPKLFLTRYADVTRGDTNWQSIPASASAVFPWHPTSTHLRRPPYLGDAWLASRPCCDIRDARILVMLGDDITTDHISPVGPIPPRGPAAKYLAERGVQTAELQTYLARRVNHDVMVRGTFTNPHLVNEICPDVPGGHTRHFPGSELMPIYEAAERYAAEHTAVVVVAGANYGVGSSRDWAAKGPALLGVRAVIAESFERIHRSNLVGMGIVPLQFPDGVNRCSLGLDGSEQLDLLGIGPAMTPGSDIECRIRRHDGSNSRVVLRSRVVTRREVSWLQSGGILNHVLHLFQPGGPPS